MSKQVDPKLLVSAGIILVILVAFFAFKALGPKPEAYTISPPEFDAYGGVAKKANHKKMMGGG